MRTLPTRDVTLADGRRLYYQQGESRQHAAHGKQASVYLTKRGPDGALRILVTVDDDPSYGEHYHLSGSYPTRTPTSDEMMAALQALIPGGGQFGAITPERNRHAMHGHVVHLVEETPRYLARQASTDAEKPAEVYARGGPRSAPVGAEDGDDKAEYAARLEMLRDDLGLVPPFTMAELRDALDQVRARRGMAPGALPIYGCTEQRSGQRGTQEFVVPYPANLPKAEQEHAQWHGLAHITLNHVPLAQGIYSADQEHEAEAWADAMMTYSICGLSDHQADA